MESFKIANQSAGFTRAVMLVAILTLAGLGRSQGPAPAPNSPALNSDVPRQPYILGADDQLTVQVLDLDEIKGRASGPRRQPGQYSPADTGPCSRRGSDAGAD